MEPTATEQGIRTPPPKEQSEKLTQDDVAYYIQVKRAQAARDIERYAKLKERRHTYQIGQDKVAERRQEQLKQVEVDFQAGNLEGVRLEIATDIVSTQDLVSSDQDMLKAGFQDDEKYYRYKSEMLEGYGVLAQASGENEAIKTYIQKQIGKSYKEMSSTRRHTVHRRLKESSTRLTRLQGLQEVVATN